MGKEQYAQGSESCDITSASLAKTLLEYFIILHLTGFLMKFSSVNYRSLENKH
jgi:hypothetical protein